MKNYKWKGKKKILIIWKINNKLKWKIKWKTMNKWKIKW